MERRWQPWGRPRRARAQNRRHHAARRTGKGRIDYVAATKRRRVRTLAGLGGEIRGTWEGRSLGGGGGGGGGRGKRNGGGGKKNPAYVGGRMCGGRNGFLFFF